jgi:hypothetical protein
MRSSYVAEMIAGFLTMASRISLKTVWSENNASLGKLPLASHLSSPS